MKMCTKYVGLDVHKDSIEVAIADTSGGEARYFGEIANTPEAVTRLRQQLVKAGARLSFCYGAGSWGSATLCARRYVLSH